MTITNGDSVKARVREMIRLTRTGQTLEAAEAVIDLDIFDVVAALPEIADEQTSPDDKAFVFTIERIMIDYWFDKP